MNSISLNNGAVLDEVCILPSWKHDCSNTSEGIRYDYLNNILVLDFHTSCGTRLLIGSWDDGLQISRWNDEMKRWEAENADVGLPFLLKIEDHSTKTNNNPIEAFVSRIPAEVLISVQPFLWRQILLLKMIRHSSNTLEMLKSNPQLVWLLADYIAEHGIPIEQGSKFLYRKRKDIVALVGGVKTESVVRSLANLRFETYTKEICSNLKQIIRDPSCFPVFKRMKIIPEIVFYKLPRYRDVIWWLVNTHKRGVENDWDRIVKDQTILYEAIDIWEDSISTAERLQIPNPVYRISQCRSIIALKRLHDEWAAQLNIIESDKLQHCLKKKYGTCLFPRPPLPGDGVIVPVTTLEQLIEEGRVMHNCVVSYVDQILESNCYIYRVLKPERATLEVCFDRGVVLPKQLKAERNRDVSVETRKMVERWILTNQTNGTFSTDQVV